MAASRPKSADPDQAAFKALLAAAKAGGPPLRTAVIHPVDALSLGAAIGAAERGLIEPVLVGPEHKIAAAAEALGQSLAAYTIEPAPHSPGGGRAGGGARGKGRGRRSHEGRPAHQ